jgi:hypothetical protein
LGSCYTKNIEKSPFFKNKLALTKKTPVLTYEYTKIFLGTWAKFFVTIALAENPRNRVKNVDLCQKPGQKMRVCLEDWTQLFIEAKTCYRCLDKSCSADSQRCK